MRLMTSFGQCPTNGNSDVPISLILDEAVTNSLEHTLPAQVSCCRCDLSPGAHSSPGGCPQTPFRRLSGVTLRTAVPGCLPTVPDSVDKSSIYDNLPRGRRCDPSTRVCAALAVERSDAFFFYADRATV